MKSLTQRSGGVFRQIKHLSQSLFTGQYFKITTFGIAFYQSNLSMTKGKYLWIEEAASLARLALLSKWNS
jgi:hypothetical protein